MKCVPRQEGKDILEEIHKGVCGNQGLPTGFLLAHAGQQGLSTGFLLAHSSTRRRRTRQKVPRLPILRQATTHPNLQASHHTTNLAFRLLGARHDWATSNCAGWIQQSIGGHRQVHQMNRGQAGYMPQG
jgi:hypothetical protein